jgi:hypothetical protein
MTNQSKVLGQELGDLIRRFSLTVSNDEIAGVLIARAMLIHLRTTNTEDAIKRMRFTVDAIEQSWVIGRKAAS